VACVSKQGQTGRFVLGYGTANAEVIQITARSTNPDPAKGCYTVTIKQALKPHAAGEAFQTNQQTITVDTTATDCPPNTCMTELMQFGVRDEFRIGGLSTSCPGGSHPCPDPPLIDIVVNADGTADITIFNPEDPYKATTASQIGDRITIAGSGVTNGAATLDGIYTVSSVILSNGSSKANHTVRIPVDASLPSGAYTTTGMTATFERSIPFVTYFGIQEDNFDQFEEARFDTITGRTTFTATFAKTHPAGSLIRGSGHVPYLNWIRSGNFVPNMGNHDNNGGEFDWCDGVHDPTPATGDGKCAEGMDHEAFIEYWGSPAGGGWPVELNKPWFEKCYGTLICWYSLWNQSTLIFGVGTPQYNEMNAAITACPAKWCVVNMHFGTFSDQCVNRQNTNCFLNDEETIVNPSYSNAGSWWPHLNPKLDTWFNGHGHHYQHVKTVEAVVGRAMHGFQAGAGGDSINGDGINHKPACTAIGDCEVLFVRHRYTTPRHDHGAAKLRVTDTELHVAFYEVNDWDTPIYEYTLMKAVSVPADSCAGTTRSCISGGVSFQ
jgi:hypothetical protein